MGGVFIRLDSYVGARWEAILVFCAYPRIYLHTTYESKGWGFVPLVIGPWPLLIVSASSAVPGVYRKRKLAPCDDNRRLTGIMATLCASEGAGSGRNAN